MSKQGVPRKCDSDCRNLIFDLKMCLILSACIMCIPQSGAVIHKPFTEHEQQAYVRYYRRLSGPLQDIQNDEALFLVAKGAEMVVKEYNQQNDINFQLRLIKEANSTRGSDRIRLHLLLEDENHQIHDSYFDIKSTLVSNHTIMTEILKPDVRTMKVSHCDKLSKEAGCTKCNAFRRCVRGHVPQFPWLDFALKTQQEIQIDEEFTSVQLPAAHNAFNNRADGYGVLDECPWPPPYKPDCISIANQEFSLTDMLNMGIRSLEFDPWWCFDEIRMSHAEYRGLGCGPWDRKFSDGMEEVGSWVHRPENAGKVIQLYFEDGPDHTQGHDDLMNGPIKEHLADRVFTPADKTALGRWPTLREMRKWNKTVIISTGYSYTHGGIYIQAGYWREFIRKQFTSYPECGTCHSCNVLRYYCDSTNYGPFWNGPKGTGVILDFTEFMKCGIQYPAADQVNPKLLETAVWTWAKGEPNRPLSTSSCVYLSGTDHRWYVSSSCNTSWPHACSSTTSPSDWVLGASDRYGQPSACPKGYQFSLPTNGFKQQKLIAVSGNQTVWINITPYISLLTT